MDGIIADESLVKKKNVDKNSKSANGNISAIILAGGYSRRMGAFKPLLKIGSLPAVDVLLWAFADAGVKRMVVVTGHEHERLERHIDHEIWHRQNINETMYRTSHERQYHDLGEQPVIETVFNEDHSKGMFASIRKGISHLDENPGRDEVLSGAFLIPVDCPVVSADTIEMMIDEIEKSQDKELFLVPTYLGKKGHPLYIPQRYWQEIADYDGTNGLKGITEKYPEKMKRIPVSDEGILLDMDDQAGYEKVKEHYLHGSEPELLSLAKGRRFLLIRHGQIRQHKEKIFLGQTDVPLSGNGLAEAEATGEKLAESIPDTDRIYTSPLMRAKDTAETIVGYLNDKMTAGKDAGTKFSTVSVEGFSEISLGEWDGRYISEIKEKYPAQFKARGENIFRFKTGNDSENFYDLQYRVQTALKEILKKDSSEDIVIVSHKGVIRVIENNLSGKSVDEPWDEMETGDIRMIDLR